MEGHSGFFVFYRHLVFLAHLLKMFPFWCLCDQLPVKILGAESLMGFPRQKHCTYVAAFSMLGERCALCDPSRKGENIRKPARGFLQTLPACLFAYDPAVCPLLCHYNKS